MQTTTPKAYIKADPEIIAEFLRTQNIAVIEELTVETGFNGNDIIVFRCLDLKQRIYFHHKNKKGRYTGIRFGAIWHNTFGFNEEDANKFNAKTMYGKIYIDPEDDNDVCLEWYINLDYRIRQSHFEEIFRRWLSLAVQFKMR